MKKFLLLICALLVTAGGWAAVTPGLVQGSQVTSEAGIVDGNKYVIRVSGGSYITEANSQYEAPSTQNAITANAVFTFNKNGDTWVVKNETTGNYWGTLTGAATSTFATANEASAGSWTFTFSGNNIVFTSGGYYINRSGGVMHGWNSTITLQIYNVEEVNLVGAISDFSNNKAYYVTTADRGAWVVPSAATALTSTTKAGLAASTSDVKQQFAFLTYGTTGVYHLYSVSEKKFVSKNGNYTTLTSELGDNVTLLSTTNASYPFVVALQDGAYQMGISNGYDPAVITFWNDLTDAGNQVQIYEVADFDPTEALAVLEATYSTTIAVTYELYESDGTTLVATQQVVQDKNSEVSLPTAWSTRYYDYATEGTIGSEDCTIKVIRTLKPTLAYPASNISNAKSYYIRTRNDARSALSTYTDAGTTYLASPVKTALSISPKKFAIINYEDNYYLYSVEDEKFVTYADNSQQLPLADMVTGTSDRVTFTGTTAPLLELMFNGSTSLILNSSSAYTYGIVVNTWGGSSSQWDDGCQYSIEEADDFDATAVLAALDNFFHPSNYFDRVEAEVVPFLMDAEGNLSPSIGKPFGLSEEAATKIVETYMTQLNTSTFTQEEYEGIVALKDAGIIYPEAGKFYLVKNNYNGKYLRLSGTARGSVFADLSAEEAAADASAHFTFEEHASQLYMTSQAAYLNWVYGAGDSYEGCASTGIDKYVHWAVIAPGVGAFSIAYGNGVDGNESYLAPGFYALKNSGTTVVAGSSSGQTNELAHWTFEEVSTLTVPLNGPVEDKYYATLCVPFDITDLTDAKAYTLTKGDGNELIMTEVSNTVAAGTPVLLEGTSATASAAISQASSTAISTATALTGNYFAINDFDGATNYVLGKNDSKVGFFHWDGATLKANRAYIAGESSESGVKGFYLNIDGADAINGIVNAAAEGDIYNLAGQRLQKLQKGVNIVGGRKVIVK